MVRKRERSMILYMIIDVLGVNEGMPVQGSLSKECDASVILLCN